MMEVAYLVLFGSLPTQSQQGTFREVKRGGALTEGVLAFGSTLLQSSACAVDGCVVCTLVPDCAVWHLSRGMVSPSGLGHEGALDGRTQKGFDGWDANLGTNGPTLASPLHALAFI